MPTSTRPDGPLGPMTDEQLSRLATGGDQAAFLELFTRHEHGLLNFCHRLTGNREDAADLVQESFLRVFARLPALEGREVNLAAYLRRTARNLAYDASAGRGAEVMVDDLEVVAGADQALETDPERAMLLGDQQAAVQRANAALPERHRLALALRELEDMDYAQIGEVLEVTPEAVGQILVRARLGLRRQLRLASVDEDRMAPACRARLGDIGALIDGQLDHDRAYVLRQHLATCATCAQVRAAFEDSRIRYRAWLPIPLIMGLGLSTLRGAQDRGLLQQFTDSISWGGDGGAGGQLGGAGQELGGAGGGELGGPAGGGTRALSGAGAAGASAGIAGAAADTLWGSWSRRRKVVSALGGAIVLLGVAGGSALFAIRGKEPPRDIVTLGSEDVTADVAAASIPPAAAQELPKPPLPGEPAPDAAPGSTDASAPSAPGDPAVSPAVITPPASPAARRRVPRTRTVAPAGASPQVTVAVSPAAPPQQPSPPPAPGTTTSAPPVTTVAPPSTTVRQPPPVVTTVRQPPPVVTTTRQPPVVTTTARTPVDPPPVTTVRVPTIRTIIQVPTIVTTIRIPTIRIPPATTTTSQTPVVR